jgi:hypothetical protein
MVSGNPTGNGETIPILRRNSNTFGTVRTSCPSTLTVPLHFTPGTKSIVRLMMRRVVLFPD